MDFSVCHFVVQKDWPLLIHPFHLTLDQPHWKNRFGECESPIILSLHKRKEERPGLFVVLHCYRNKDVSIVIDESFNDNEEDFNTREIALDCSPQFIDHYKLEPFLDKSLLFSHVTAFPINRLVIAAQSVETFLWTKRMSFETGLLLASTCNRSLLVRSTDTILSPPLSTYGDELQEILRKFNDMVVVDCSPVLQGVIDINTKVVIIQSQNIPVLPIPSVSSSNCDTGRLKIEVDDSLVWKLHSRKHDSRNADLATIFCSESTARNSCGNSCSFATLHLTLEKHSGFTQEFERTFKIQSVADEDFEASTKNVKETVSSHPQTLVMSSCCWFNCVGPKHFPGLSFPPADYSITLNGVDSSAFAREIHLSLVLSPQYSPAGCYDSCLLTILSQPQLLYVGDVISINVEGDYDFLDSADPQNYRCCFIYYKVVKFETGANDNVSYLVDTKHTAVYQDGRINSFIPPILQATELSNVLRHLAAPGLSRYVDDLTNIALPYLDKEQSFTHVCSVLLSGPQGCGIRNVVNTTCDRLGIHLMEIDCLTLTSDTPGASEAKINEAFRRASTYSPCAILLSGLENIGVSRESNRADNRVVAALRESISNLPVRTDTQLPAVVIGTTSSKADVISDVRMLFLHQINMDPPQEDDRLAMLIHASQSLNLSPDIGFKWLAKHTAGFVLSDVWELMRKSLQVAFSRVKSTCAVGSRLTWVEEECLRMAGVAATYDDIVEALHEMQADKADTIGVPKIPTVQWEDVGGLEEVKSHILDTIQLPIEHPELASTGLRRSGLLLYGPPGTGKTLLAKAVASQCSLSFLSVKGPELINMYVGQSEANVRRIFQRARDAAPCIIFFDELDALAPNRGRSGDSGGVMDRVVSQLLAELDGVNTSDSSDKQVFIIAASNRPDLIDEALLRPGRLDKMLYVGLSGNKEDKMKILRSQTRKLSLSPLVNFDEIIEACPPNLTGADFHGLTNEAALNSIRRTIGQLESDSANIGPCVVEQSDFIEAARNIIPSINEKQLENYKRVKSEMAR